jgi:endothelin-converting enzyme/putative endopeptidase
MKLCRSALLLSLLAAGSAGAQAPAAAPAPPTLVRFDASSVDKSVDPCVDFQQYACGAYFKANPIPPDQVVWGKASPLQLWNETILRETLEAAAAKSSGRSPIEQQIGDYYAACMDEAGIEKTAPAEIKAELARIDAITAKNQLVDLVARIHMRHPGAWEQGNNQTDTVLFGLTAVQDFDDATLVLPQFDHGGMNLPGRDFYLATDERSTAIRTKYLAHVAKMLVLAGAPEAQAKTDAAAVLALETEFARVAMDNVKRRDPKNSHNVMTLAQVQALTPSFDFARYLSLVGAPKAGRYQVTAPDFFRGLEKLIQGRPLSAWKAYLRYSALHFAAPTLHQAVLQENWEFFARTLSGAQQLQPRWRRCVRAADRDLGEALGQAYVARAFPPESKAGTSVLVKAVEAALDKDIDGLSWMTPATKQKAKEKLKGILDKVGYPDKWIDYSSVVVGRTSMQANVAAASKHEYARWLAKIGQPVDRQGWVMTPATINAYYDAQMNTINFPAGILQPPFFDATQDVAVNFGAIGAVVGHEIIHGFDDQGRKFDGQGNLRDWWTESDAKAYDERGKCISDQYTQDVPEFGVKTNGLLTQGEDTADNGGLYLALIALETTLAKEGKGLETKGSDGLTSLQRFYLGFASDWCTQYRPEIARTVILTNPHSLAKFRVNNVVSNMPEFARAFGCKKGQPMARENACRVW